MATERARVGAFLISEAQGTRAREQGTALALNDGTTIIQSGTLAARVAKGAVTGAAGGTNTGNATIGTLSALANSVAGIYSAIALSATRWAVYDPTGRFLGVAVNGTAFAVQVAFTITAGGTPAVAGDTFAITVAAGSTKLVKWNPSGTNGSETIVGVFYNETDVSGSTDQTTTYIARGAEVASAQLIYNGADAGQKTAANAALLALGIHVRTGV